MVGYNPTPTDFYEDYIAHYGVKGMKWRHRKGKKKGDLRSDLKWKTSKAKNKALSAKTNITRTVKGARKNDVTTDYGKTNKGMDPSSSRSTDSKSGPSGSTYSSNQGYSKSAMNSGAYSKKSRLETMNSTYGNYYNHNGRYEYKKKRK